MGTERIPVEVNIRSAVEGIRNLNRISREISGLRRQGQRPIPDPTRRLREGARRTEDAFRGLGRRIGAVLGAAAIARFAQQSVREFARVEGAFRGLETVAAGTGVGVGNAFQEASRLAADGLIDIGDASRALQNLLQRGIGLEDAITLLNRLKDAAAFNRSAQLSLGEAVVSATEGIRLENSVLLDNAGIGKNISVIYQEFAAQIGKTVEQLTQQEKNQAIVNGILRESEIFVGNAARAQETLQGEIAKSDVAVQRFQASLGEALVPVVRSLAIAGRALIANFLRPAITFFQVLQVRATQLFTEFSNLQSLFSRGGIDFAEFRRRNARAAEEAAEEIARIRERAERQQLEIEGGARGTPDADVRARFLAGQESQAPDPRAERRGARARLTAARSQADAELEIAREGFRAQTEALEEELADRLISFRQFAERRTAIEQAGIDAEIAAVRERIAAEQAARGDATEEDRIRSRGQVAQLEARLIVLNNRRAAVERSNARQAAASERELADALANVRDEVARLTGSETGEQRRAAIAREFRTLRERLVAEGDQAGAALIDRLVDVRAAEARFTQLEGALGRSLDRIRDEQQVVSAQQAAGLLTESQARQRIVELQRQSAELIRGALPDLQAAAAALGPEAQASVARWRTELEQAAIVVDDLALRLQGEFQDAFTELFDNLASGASSARDAFLDFARSVIGAIRRILAERLAERLIGQLSSGSGGGIFGILSGLLRGGGGRTIPLAQQAISLAAGGVVRGPGTATSDSVPAQLSAGEYVLRAAAVRQIGVGLLDRLNGLRAGPAVRGARLHFQEGGLVPAGGGGGGDAAGIRIINVIDPAMAGEFIDSAAGERSVLNVISRNRDAVRQVLS